MAAVKRFVCDLCDLEFNFQSKYQRHLNSAGHKRYSSVQSPPLEQEEPMAMVTDEPLLGDNEEPLFLNQVSFQHPKITRLYYVYCRAL